MRNYINFGCQGVGPIPNLHYKYHGFLRVRLCAKLVENNLQNPPNAAFGGALLTIKSSSAPSRAHFEFQQNLEGVPMRISPPKKHQSWSGHD